MVDTDYSLIKSRNQWPHRVKSRRLAARSTPSHYVRSLRGSFLNTSLAFIKTFLPSLLGPLASQSAIYLVLDTVDFPVRCHDVPKELEITTDAADIEVNSKDFKSIEPLLETNRVRSSSLWQSRNSKLPGIYMVVWSIGVFWPPWSILPNQPYVGYVGEGPIGATSPLHEKKILPTRLSPLKTVKNWCQQKSTTATPLGSRTV